MASSARRQRNFLLVGLCALIFLAGSLVLVNDARLYTSPDETANAHFSEVFAQSSTLQGRYDPLSPQIENRIHPRSTVSVNGTLLPGSFLGLPFLYGVFSKVLTVDALPFFTPLLTLLAAWAWHKLSRKFLNSQVSLVSTLFFLFHPAVWYYSARGLMHNMLFINLLVLALWLWICKPLKKKGQELSLTNDGLSGWLVAMAIFVRTSEAVWVLVAIVLSALIWRRHISWRRVRVAIVGFGLGIGLLLGVNWLTYGDPFTTGYTVGVITPEAPAQITETIDTVEILPFGFHPRTALRHFFDYAVVMFWWLTLLAVPGVWLFLKEAPHKRTRLGLLAIATLVSGWLVVTYGSWEIFDNPDPTQVTMANSYVRYWLPIYLAAVPLMATTVVNIAKRFKKSRRSIIATVTLVGVVLALNVQAVFFQGQDGLLSVREELLANQVIQKVVLSQTPENAVIIVDRGDKILFPHRDVMYPLRDQGTYDSMPVVASQRPLYYFGVTFPPEDLEYLNTRKLAERGLQIKLIESFDIESLYQIYTP